MITVIVRITANRYYKKTMYLAAHHTTDLPFASSAQFILLTSYTTKNSQIIYMTSRPRSTKITYHSKKSFPIGLNFLVEIYVELHYGYIYYALYDIRRVLLINYYGTCTSGDKAKFVCHYMCINKSVV